MADDRSLVKETNERFWARTNYKPGRKLDMSDPSDRKMSKIWLLLYDEVRGHRDRATFLARTVYGETNIPYILIAEKPDGTMSPSHYAQRGNLNVQYAWLVDQPEMYRYIAMYDFTKDPNVPLQDQFARAAAAPAAVAGWYGW
jgi:hypothetical protein